MGDREAWCAAVHGVIDRHDNRTTTILLYEMPQKTKSPVTRRVQLDSLFGIDVVAELQTLEG